MGPFFARSLKVCLVVGVLSSGNAFSRTSKPAAVIELEGHIPNVSPTRFVIHIDAFTPDQAADVVARAGAQGNSDAIRTAMGQLDAGFIKIGNNGYRVAYARRRWVEGGIRLILVLRNALQDGLTNGKEIVHPPLAAVDVWLPADGNGQAVVSLAAVAVFHSADDIDITDWAGGDYVARDLKVSPR